MIEARQIQNRLSERKDVFLLRQNINSQENEGHDHERRTENVSKELFNLPLLFDKLVKRYSIRWQESYPCTTLTVAGNSGKLARRLKVRTKRVRVTDSFHCSRVVCSNRVRSNPNFVWEICRSKSVHQNMFVVAEC